MAQAELAPAAAPPRPAVTERPFRLAQIAVAIILLFKIYLAFAGPPVGDEAYYWIWGQKLGWSYFDHPPLHAWLLRVVSVFGWNLFSLRLLTWLTLGGTLWIFWLWAKRLKPEDPAAWFWPTAAIYLASPVFFWTSGISFHDHLLTFLCIASASVFLRFAETWEATGKGWRWLYLAATLLGLAVLTKYNGVLLGIGVAVFFVVHKPLRPLWRSPHLYLAGLLSVALQAPVIWWNITEGFASYKFHLSERWGGELFKFTPTHALTFVALTFVAVGPFLFPAIIRLIRKPLGTPFADRARSLALSVFVVSTLTMGFLSFFIEIFFYWNIVAYILMMPMLAGWFVRRRVMLAHIIFGALIALTYSYHSTINPANDWTLSSTFGWNAVAKRVAVFEKKYKTDFVAATRYTTAAQLAFAMHDPEVTAIADRHDQYDYWFDPAAHEGKDAIVVSDQRLGLKEIEGHFDELTKLQTVPYKQFGLTIYSPTIYLGKRYHSKSTK